MTDLPEPLVPQEVDLRDFHFTPIFRARLFGSSFHARSTDAEWRAGVTLWLKSWDQVPAGTLPDDDIDLCRLAELGRDMKAWRKVKQGAMHGWRKCSDGRLHHQVVAEGVLEAWSKRTSAKKKGIAGAAARWGTSNATAIAQAMPDDSKGSKREVEEKGEEKHLSGSAPDSAHNGHDSLQGKELRAQAAELLAFLNEKAGRHYKPVAENLNLIVSLLKKGTTPDDIRAVIAMKVREWKGNPDFDKYLRPSTLFGPKNYWQKYEGELTPVEAMQ